MISAIDLEAIETSYYVEPTATSDVIDYKDPCKAGKILERYLPHLCGAQTCHEMLLCVWKLVVSEGNAFGDDSGESSFKRYKDILNVFIFDLLS